MKKDRLESLIMFIFFFIITLLVILLLFIRMNTLTVQTNKQKQEIDSLKTITTHVCVDTSHKLCDSVCSCDGIVCY